jgi:hydroxymethylglutaryl-CoA lyase
VKVRGYVSCVLGCPYEGAIAPQAVADVAATLLDMGCYEVSLGDTIGVGTPAHQAHDRGRGARVPVEKLAGHYHDTYGMAVANIYASLQMGVAVFDSLGRRPGRLPLCRRRLGQRRHRGRGLVAERTRHRHRHRRRR